MRKLKEILKIVYNELKYGDEFQRGLCSMVYWMYKHSQLTFEEQSLFKIYMHKHKPAIHWWVAPAGWYWIPGWKYPRLRWLKRHIRKNS